MSPSVFKLHQFVSTWLTNSSILLLNLVHSVKFSLQQISQVLIDFHHESKFRGKEIYFYILKKNVYQM